MADDVSVAAEVAAAVSVDVGDCHCWVVENVHVFSSCGVVVDQSWVVS